MAEYFIEKEKKRRNVFTKIKRNKNEISVLLTTKSVVYGCEN